MSKDKDYIQWMAKVWKMNDERNGRNRPFLVDKKNFLSYHGKRTSEIKGSNMVNIFIDDERYPVNESDVILRNLGQVVDFIEEMKRQNEKVSFISFDHDLGENQSTGYDIVKYIVKQDMEYGIFAEDFDFYVHSQNPVGKKNIEQYMKNYFRAMKEK